MSREVEMTRDFGKGFGHLIAAKAENAKDDAATADTKAMPQSDPPPTNETPNASNDLARTETGSFDVAIADGQASEVADMPAPSAPPPPPPRPRRRRDSRQETRAAPAAAPPFEAQRISDSGPAPTPSAAPAATVVPNPATATPQTLRPPRPRHERIAVPIVTPEQIRRRDLVGKIARGVAITLGLLAFFTVIVGGVLWAGISAFTLASERGWFGGDELVAEHPVEPSTRHITVAEPEVAPTPTTPPVIAPTPPRPSPPIAEPTPTVAPTSDPGLAVSGQPSGTFVTVRAGDAFPSLCATRIRERLPGVRGIFCGLGARQGDNICDCRVSGHVP